MNTTDRLRHILSLAKVVPVITIDDPDKAVPLAKALVAGGLKALEITLRTDAALESIRRIAAEVPEAVPGAGTILRPEHIDQVAKAGGQFCVSPGATDTLLARARDTNMPFLPGAATATEVMRLLDAGLTYLKFFPAEATGGVKLLKSWSAPMPQAIFCPTGGINPNNAGAYLALPNVICVGGTWVAPKDAVASGDWEKIQTCGKLTEDS